jgi:SAM-dependent methyltransferase
MSYLSTSSFFLGQVRLLRSFAVDRCAPISYLLYGSAYSHQAVLFLLTTHCPLPMTPRDLYYQLPPHLRMLARRLYYLPLDLWEGWTGQRHPYQPPKGQIYIGSGDFLQQGQHHLDLLRHYLSLSPEATVLDVGSGIGRSAVALTAFLRPPGRYEGFDVVEKGVRWCQQRISRDHAHFRFTYVPLHNDLYNATGQDATAFRFPYPDAQFDAVFLFSVFTHMVPAEIGHYLQEISRVLRPGGQCLASFFTYAEADQDWIADPSRAFNFPVDHGDHRLMHPQVKSANVALSQTLLARLAREANLRIAQQVPGYWRDTSLKAPHVDFQDLVVFVK